MTDEPRDTERTEDGPGQAKPTRAKVRRARRKSIVAKAKKPGAKASAARRKPLSRTPIATSRSVYIQARPEPKSSPGQSALAMAQGNAMRSFGKREPEAEAAGADRTAQALLTEAGADAHQPDQQQTPITEPFRKVDAPVEHNASAVADYEPDASGAALRGILWAQAGIVTALLIIGGLLFLLLPKQQISDDENRKLAPPPVFSLAAFFEGKFSDETEAYYNDNFLFRNKWLSISDQVKGLRGYRDDDTIEVVRKPPVAAPKINERASPELVADPEYQKVRALVITKGRAVQNFGGTPGMVRPFADLMNDYRAALPDDVKVYSMVIPSGSDFFLPKEVHDGELRERDNIDAFNEMLDPSIITASAYDELAPHTKKYIWFNTDHHWTGLGAYYAYSAFVREAGLKPLPLRKFKRKRLPGTFLGSLYRQTRSKSLESNPDFTEYWKIPNKAKAYLVTWQGNESEIPLYFEEARGGNSYGVFLGGDKPVIRITTDRKNGRKLLMIKDSYGNALAPYLAANFEEVVVVDFRFFKGSIPEMVDHYGITDFLYAHNSFAANTAGTVKLGRAMLGGAAN